MIDADATCPEPRSAWAIALDEDHAPASIRIEVIGDEDVALWPILSSKPDLLHAVLNLHLGLNVAIDQVTDPLELWLRHPSSQQLSIQARKSLFTFRFELEALFC